MKPYPYLLRFSASPAPPADPGQRPSGKRFLIAFNYQFSDRDAFALVVLVCFAIWGGTKPAMVIASENATTSSQDWPQWRGPTGTGAADPSAKPPTTWSESVNLRWKTAIPGLGHSSPIVLGSRVFVTTAVADGETQPPTFSGAPGAHDNLPVRQAHSFYVLALDRKTGDILWKSKLANVMPHEGGHHTGSLASASPVADDLHVYASFGSHGIGCYDMAGKLVWSRNLGRMQSKHGHGEGASPLLYDGRLFVNWDHEGQSFMVALDSTTGRTIWKMDRDEVTSWCSPIAVEHAGRTQIIACGTTRVRAYDYRDGKVIWECGGLSGNVVATPVAGAGIVYVGSSYEIRSMMAIQLDAAAGDITGSSNILWKRRMRTPYVPSPLLYRDQVYFLAHYQNVLSRVEGKSGEEPIGPFRLGPLGNIYASPVAADGRVYVTDLEGVTQVIHAGEIPRPLAVNRLDDRFSASAAIAGDAIFLRGAQYLYCLAEDPSSTSPQSTFNPTP